MKRDDPAIRARTIAVLGIVRWLTRTSARPARRAFSGGRRPRQADAAASEGSATDILAERSAVHALHEAPPPLAEAAYPDPSFRNDCSDRVHRPLP